MNKKQLITIFSFIAIIAILGFKPPQVHHIPQGIPYQAILRDGNNPIADAVVLIRFTIFQDGIQTYQEEQITNTNEYGLVHVSIGTGTPTTGSNPFTFIDWSNQEVELQVEMDYDQSGYTDFGRMLLQTVPFAFLAQKAETSKYAQVAESIQNVKLANLIDVSSSTPATGNVLTWDGNRWKPAPPPTSGPGTVWATSGGNVFRTNGRVCIGCNNPQVSLQVDDFVRISNNGNRRIDLHAQFNEGRLALLGPNSGNIYLGAYNAHHGFLAIQNHFSHDRVKLLSYDYGGRAEFLGPNGNYNAVISSTTSSGGNKGYFEICDQNGARQVWMYVNNQGDGRIKADIKNFEIPHPLNPNKTITYACIEGPEAAAYERGTAALANGEVFVPFSEHFGIVGNHRTMTVSLTPLSADSKGLAVIEKTSTGFRVKELYQGQGNYSFDWEVKSVRKGYEDYDPTPDKNEDQPARPKQSSTRNK